MLECFAIGLDLFFFGVFYRQNFFGEFYGYEKNDCLSWVDIVPGR